MSRIPGKKPNVLMICIDSLRADCLEPERAGSIWEEIGRPDTPCLDGWRENSHLWTTATSTSSWTKPAVPSILLSLYPTEHGIFETAKSGGKRKSPGFPPRVNSLPEMLRNHGYLTLGLTHNAQFDSIPDFSRGFDEFTSCGGNVDDLVDSLCADDRLAGSEPWFVYMHVLEPHYPYDSRVREYLAPHRVGRFPFHQFRGEDWKEFKSSLKMGDIFPTDEETRFLRQAYRASVERVDTALGRLFHWLGEPSRQEDSVVILTSDHGEELLDHGSIGHGQGLYEELIRVPLSVRLPGMLSDRVDEIPRSGTVRIAHVDLAPTILDLLEIRPPDYWQGSSILGVPEAGERAIFSEVKHKRRYRQAVTRGRHKLIRSYRFRRAEDGDSRSDYNQLDDLFACRTHQIERHLYDLDSDPGELTDLSSLQPDRVLELENLLDHWWRALPRMAHGVAEDLDVDVIRRLKALGYM